VVGFHTGAECDYADRDAHLVGCRAFKEAWEEALRRLVEELTAAQVRRYIARISQFRLCADAAAFCALAETRGDVDEAVSRLSDETYRRDMALASTLHGTAALDRKLRTAYVPGHSGSDHTTTEAPSLSSRRLVAEAEANFGGTAPSQPRAHYFVE